jgi:amino acid adenylation domain-containing protein
VDKTFQPGVEDFCTDQSATIIGRLQHWARIRPKDIACTFFDGDPETDQVDNITFGSLDRKARAIATLLKEQHAQNERAILLLPSGLEFLAAFFGCLYAGTMAIPAFPIRLGTRSRRQEQWFDAIVKDANPRFAFAPAQTITQNAQEAQRNPCLSGIQWLSTSDAESYDPERWERVQFKPTSLAFLQYTSGSTSIPKGVMVSHGNLMHNQRVIQAACGSDTSSTVVSWLPLHHDMGLIGTALHPIYVGARAVLMPPSHFLHNPASWLAAMTRFKGVCSSAPNFAYDLCSDRVNAEQKQKLDLSSWKVAINGAEPVRHQTLCRFATAFKECGFRAETFRPSYGLAECTLMVTSQRAANSVQTKRVSAVRLESGEATESTEGENHKILVSCGPQLADQDIKIVNPETGKECLENNVGEVWVSSPSVAQGYWNRTEETERTFRASLTLTGEGPYLRTGDLGFLSDNDLFLTGRLKEMLVIYGRNLYPQDIELTALNSHRALQGNSCIAFSIEHLERDSLAVVCEVDRHADFVLEELIQAIRNAITVEHGIQPQAVALVRSRSLPKTTSGKPKRLACRELFNSGKLPTLAASFLETHISPPTTTPTTAKLSASEIVLFAQEERQDLLERHIRRFLAAISGASLNAIGTTSTLVSLGLDSIAALALKHMLYEQFAVTVELQYLITEATVSDLAATVMDQIASAPVAVAHPDSPTDPSMESKELQLSAGQRGLWVINQRMPYSSAYHLGGAATIHGEIDLEALRTAIVKLTSHHELLRVKLRVDKGEPLLVVQNPATAFHLPCDRVQISDPDSIRTLVEAAWEQPFRLDVDLPFRVKVLGLSARKHLLVLTIHHLVADFWSLGIMLRDLGILYEAELTREPVKLGPASCSYREFVENQQALLTSPEGENHLRYWQDRLAGELPVLQLSTDRPRPSSPSMRGSSILVHLPPVAIDRLGAYARANNATMFALLAAVFQLFLHRISGQDDVLIGTPTSGRDNPAFRDVVGYFVNPIVLRSCYEGGVPFSSYFAATKQLIFDAFSHRAYPFPLLVEQLRPQRDASISPVFQTMFALQRDMPNGNLPLSSLSVGTGGVRYRIGRLEMESLELASPGSQFDLTLMIAESSAGLLASWKFSTDLFLEATVRQMADQFNVLLDGVAANPDLPLARYPLITEQAQSALLAQLTPPTKERARPAPLLVELFEAQVTGSPQATALAFKDSHLSYDELNRKANQFARYLKTLGVHTESRVGIFLERSMEMIVGLLGIWKSGGAYVPMDIRDPKERLASVVNRAGLDVLITHELLLDRLPDKIPQLVLLDLDLDLIALEDDGNLGLEPLPASLAYVLCTSGSSGTPKLVMIEHGSVGNLLAGLGALLYDKSRGLPLVVGLNAPLAFDSSIKQLASIAFGHTLCIIPEELRRNGQALLAYTQAQNIGMLDCTPTQLTLLLDTGFVPGLSEITLLVGGEEIPSTLWNKLGSRELRPNYNVYGPTECAVDVIACKIEPDAAPSLGQPLSGTYIYVLDGDLMPVPSGVAGEIFIGGANVGRGYLEEPVLTAQRFLPDPYGRVPGSRMYRTGDRGCYRSDGTIGFLGRVDRQIKLRGLRIELGEIESALENCEGIDRAVAVLTEGLAGDRRIVAYVVPHEPDDATSYKSMLAGTLPDYMVPSAIIPLRSMPMTVNGKVDYAALPEPAITNAEQSSSYVAPRTPLEGYLAELWSSILKIEPVGIHDNFFMLGGDSIQGTRMTAQIQQELSLGPETALLAHFFQSPTIAALSDVLADLSVDEAMVRVKANR